MIRIIHIFLRNEKNNTKNLGGREGVFFFFLLPPSVTLARLWSVLAANAAQDAGWSLFKMCANDAH